MPLNSFFPSPFSFFTPLKNTLLNFSSFLFTYLGSFEITIPAGAEYALVTIPQRNLNYSIIIYAGFVSTMTTYDPQCTLRFLNATTVQCDNVTLSTGKYTTCSFFVLEFNPFLIKSIQPIWSRIDGNQTIKNTTITAVDTSKSIILFAGLNPGGAIASFPSRYCRHYFTSPTVVTSVRAIVDPISLYFSYFVIQFS